MSQKQKEKASDFKERIENNKHIKCCHQPPPPGNHCLNRTTTKTYQK